MARKKVEYIKVKLQGSPERHIPLDTTAGVFLGDHGVLEVLATWYEQVKQDKTTADRIRETWKNQDVALYIKTPDCMDEPIK